MNDDREFAVFLSAVKKYEGVLKLVPKALRSMPRVKSLNGMAVLRASGLLWDSTRTTVAPCSASSRATWGPTPTQEKSATRIPSKICFAVFLLLLLK